jgi:hypothetical protein
MNKQTFGLAVAAFIRHANADLPHFERTLPHNVTTRAALAACTFQT